MTLADTDTTRTVLCIDDEPNILAALRRLFRADGYRVLVAESGPAGLALLEQETVDMVISDMRMPEMTGAKVLEQVCKLRPDVIRILLTGYADIQSIQAAINTGEIYRYIAKPWDDNDMLLTVRQAFERRELVLQTRRLEELTRRQNAELKVLNQSLEAKVEERTRELRIQHDAAIAANEKLKQNYLTTIKVFSNIMEMRSRNAPGHARKIAELVRQMAQQLKLDPAESRAVFVAALLHDIGKIGFSDELLATPFTQLQGDALAQYRKHTIRAEQLLMALSELRETGAILRSQMERFDGTGFPDGLRGLAIPMGARILALAVDYYNLQDGAIVQRHLRPDEARSLVIDASGKRYDPHVVQAFRAIVDGPEDSGQGLATLSGELVPGMVLARDLISKDGLMLLSADHVLDERMIAQVRDFENKSGGRLPIWIRKDK
ncbi:HD domain-containing phosphohydrolase [Massilia sp. SM-13]|uniref:HD domain-containing phosphohydrolase n=1 Tax=Pseudoduganella rhizocola TaxID=3382643 RepID=UPI0038B48338